MVSVDGVTWVLGANACTIRTHYLTWTTVCAQHNCVNGGGIRFGAIFDL
jgi:hypothetical protein